MRNIKQQTMDYTAIEDSLGRCINHGKVFERFYDEFLASDPAIAEHFKNTDMQKQHNLLKNGINLAIMFAEENPVGINGINRIRKSHSRARLDIHPELYHLFLDSFIRTIAECDSHFDSELEKQWRSMLQMTIDYIIAGYDE